MKTAQFVLGACKSSVFRVGAAGLFCAGAAIAAAGPSAAAVTFQGADVGAFTNGQIVGKAQASLNGSGSDSTSNLTKTSLDAETGDLSAGTRYKGVKTASLSASESATADLSTPNTAVFEFSGDQSAHNISTQEASIGGSSQGDWNFSLSGPATLTLSYALSDLNPGTGGLEYQILNRQTKADIQNILMANSSGMASFALSAGSYIVALDDEVEPYIDLTAKGSAASSHDDVVTLSLKEAVSAAPEPASWTLMLMATAMIGSALRLRRRGSAFA